MTFFEQMAAAGPEVAFPFYGVQGSVFRIGDHLFASTFSGDWTKRVEHVVRYVCHMKELPPEYTLAPRLFRLTDSQGRLCPTGEALDKRFRNLLVQMEPLAYVQIRTHRDLPSGRAGLGPDCLFTGYTLVEKNAASDLLRIRWLLFGLVHQYPDGNTPLARHFDFNDARIRC